MRETFGTRVRQRREALRARDPAFSLRAVAGRIGVQPSYLSRIERGLEGPPAEPRIRALAAVLGVDPDVLLAAAGRVAEDVQRIVRARPRLLAGLLRGLADAPDHAVVSLARKVREGLGPVAPASERPLA